MADLYKDQQYDETTMGYLARFMDLTSQIFDLDLKQAANLFVRSLVKGSLLHVRFLESSSYDLGELKARAEGILRVEGSIQQIVKNDTIIVSQNNSRTKELRDYSQRTGDDSRAGRPQRNIVEDKRKSSYY